MKLHLAGSLLLALANTAIVSAYPRGPPTSVGFRQDQSGTGTLRSRTPGSKSPPSARPPSTKGLKRPPIQPGPNKGKGKGKHNTGAIDPTQLFDGNCQGRPHCVAYSGQLVRPCPQDEPCLNSCLAGWGDCH
ncbi:hypothetical protein MAPG_09468 [Magnaporthiopsis poae ATCC 64411]|uniref:Uncharacterized protein n=1 Tax=Magnaporthiopsis poae (strain ATCC 64411 / 73-15) TaxID=644358 RepID=A0A0C4EA14_MAGP6|nr:hypothetical protein MAPG_09468 [Magnaporthiopsis poae ATCC 64411]